MRQIDEDFSLIEELLAMVPIGQENWRPDWPGDTPFTVAELAAHLAESCGAVCACFAKLHPGGDFARHESVGAYRLQLRQFEALTEDAQLAQIIPTYFVPAGEPFLTVLLTNLKHVNHHAHQLFTYLKLLGVPVGTRHLYRV